MTPLVVTVNVEYTGSGRARLSNMDRKGYVLPLCLGNSQTMVVRYCVHTCAHSINLDKSTFVVKVQSFMNSTNVGR